MNTKVLIIRGPEQEQELRAAVPESTYNRNRQVVEVKLGRATKLPNYNDWIKNVIDYSSHCAAVEHNAYYMAYPVVIEYCGYVLPMLFTRDEQVHDERSIIPTILFDVYSVDHVHMWTHGVPEVILRELGLKMTPYGIENPLVYTRDRKGLSRFTRYQKLVTQVNAYYNREEQKAVLDAYMPDAKAYWESQGVKTTISNEDMEMYDGDGRVRTVVLEVIQSNGGRGAGMFSMASNNELYWDFSRRNEAPHIGNNILLAGVDYALSKGRDNLNLGVGFYAWKKNWSKGNSIWLPGVEFTSADGYARTLCDTLFEEVGEPHEDGYNKERTTA